MSFNVRNAFRSALFGNNDVCLLCHKAIEEKSSNIYEKVHINESQEIEEIFHILDYVLGKKVAVTSILNTICIKCNNTAINCYEFIKMCKENSENLSQAINSLKDSIKNTSEDFGALFVRLDTDNYTSEHFYEGTKAHKTCSAAQRLQSIVKNESMPNNTTAILGNSEIKSETRFRLKTTGKLKKNIVYDIPTILTSELIKDKNKCKVCLKTFKNTKILRCHYFRYHHPKNFKCSSCRDSFLTKEHLEQHYSQKHVGNSCSICGKSFVTRSVLRHHERSHFTKIVCQQCGRVYRSEEAFRTHIRELVCVQKSRKTSNQGKLECNYCSKRYNCKPYLAKHIKFEHENAEGHKCEYCNKQFYTQSLLRVHLVKHTLEKNFICSICECRFGTKTALLYHTRLHTGECPYKCDYCERAFLSASRRLDHMRRHHMMPLLKCNICDKAFKASGSLLRHRKRHYDPKSRLNRFPQFYLPVEEEVEIS